MGRAVEPKERRRFAEHRAYVTGVAFSPDGRRVVSIDDSGAIVSWSLMSGQRLASARAEATSGLRGALAVAFAPDGTLLVCEPAGLRRRDGHTLEPIGDLVPARTSKLAFGGGGAWVLCEDRVRDAVTLAIRAVATAEGVAFVRWPHACAHPATDAVLLCDDGGYDDSIHGGHGALREVHLSLYDATLRTLRRRRVFDRDDAVRATAFDPATGRFLFATARGEIVAWTTDGATSVVLARVERAVALHASGQAVVVAVEKPPRLLFWPQSFEGEPTTVTLPELAWSTISPNGEWLLGGAMPTGEGDALRFPLVLFDLDVLAPRPEGTPLVTPAQIRHLGFEWPPDARTAKSFSESDGRIDLDATRKNLESAIAWAREELLQMRVFASKWGAPVDDVSDRREEMGETMNACAAAIARIDAIRKAVLESGPLPDVAEPSTALLQCVLDAPDDDAPRLAYAEALGDDPHAALIRVQCELEPLPAWSPRRRWLENEEMGLLHRHRAKWAAPLERYGSVLRFARGFIEKLKVEPSSFPRDAAKIFALAPIQTLVVSSLATPQIPELARLRAVACSSPAELLESRYLADLHALSVNGEARHESGQEFPWYVRAAASGNVRGLASLSLWRAEGTAKGLEKIAYATMLPKLTALHVSGPPLGAEVLAKLAQSPLAARLTRLELGLSDMEDARALASGTFPALETLVLDGNLGHATLAALLPLRAPKLRALCLRSFHVDETSARALAATPMPELRDFEIFCGLRDIDEASLRALAEAPWLAGLERLEVRAPEVPLVAFVPVVAATQALRCLSVSAVDGLALPALVERAASSLVALGVGGGVSPKAMGAALAKAKVLEGVSIARPSKEVSRKLERAGLRRLDRNETFWMRTRNTER